MNFRSFSISFAVGVLLDIALVWLFYWLTGQKFEWLGFWFWQGILIAAATLLWLRRLLGFAIWYVFAGRDAISREIFHTCLENNLKPFDVEWDKVDTWLNEQLPEKLPGGFLELTTALVLIRQQGLWQHVMMKAAYKQGALRYSKYLRSRGAI